MKKSNGGPLGDFEKFPKKIKYEIFEQFHRAAICETEDPLGFFDIHCVAKYRNKRRGDSFESKKLQKCRIVPKKFRMKNT